MERLRIVDVTINPNPAITGQAYRIVVDVVTITPEQPNRLPQRLSGRLGTYLSGIQVQPRLAIVLGRKGVNI